MRLQAALFDFDGTLVNSDPAHLAAFNEILVPFERQMSQAQYDRDVLGRTNLEIFSHLFPGIDAEAAITLGDAKEAAYLRRSDLVRAHSGAEVVLARLKAEGIRLALVTNAPRHVVMDLAPRLGLLPYFDIVITADDVTFGKPHPEPYQLALSQLGVAAEDAIVIEDSETGRRAAESAGIRVLLLTPATTPVTMDAASTTTVISNLQGVLDQLGFVAGITA